MVHGLTQTLNNGFDISVFPNPATDKLNVQLSGFSGNNKILVELLDIFGKQGFSIVLEGKTSFEIPLQSIPSGVYILKTTLIDNPNMVFYTKVIVSK